MQRLKLTRHLLLKSLCQNLHSTMQRLKPTSEQLVEMIRKEFTFHYAKIKTPEEEEKKSENQHLHSTMQRLKLETSSFKVNGVKIYIPLCKD